jgi:hypothetical protein
MCQLLCYFIIPARVDADDGRDSIYPLLLAVVLVGVGEGVVFIIIITIIAL